jgi:mlo protein
LTKSDDYFFEISTFQLLVIVGTKLQVIITTMALQIQDRSAVVQGTRVVKPNDQLFWFSRPRWILYLIHFTLFQVPFTTFSFLCYSKFYNIFLFMLQ